MSECNERAESLDRRLEGTPSVRWEEEKQDHQRGQESWE